MAEEIRNRKNQRRLGVEHIFINFNGNGQDYPDGTKYPVTFSDFTLQDDNADAQVAINTGGVNYVREQYTFTIENVTILTAATGLSNVITYSIMQQFPNIKHLTVQNGVEYTGSTITSGQLNSFTIEGNGVITDSWANTFGENITKSLTISGYITEIASSENYVVWGSALTEIHVGSRVQTIGSNVFAKANNVATLNLQNAINLTEIGDEAFYNNAALTQIDFPTSLQTIGSKAFANATNLSVIAGGAGLQTIGDGAFEGTAWYANQQDFVFTTCI